MIQPLLDRILDLLRTELKTIVCDPESQISFGSPSLSQGGSSIGLYPGSIELAGYAPLPLRSESSGAEFSSSKVERASECSQEFFLEIYSCEWGELDRLISLISGLLALQLDRTYAPLPNVTYRIGAIATSLKMRRVTQLGVDYLGEAGEPKARLRFSVEMKFSSAIELIETALPGLDSERAAEN
ncbi:MAG: hypothetical protein ACFB9N_01305 [Geitlerinemataceae cyanobacterium]